MTKHIESTITWHIKRARYGLPNIRQILYSLVTNHGLTLTQAEDALVQYEATHYGTVRHD